MRTWSRESTLTGVVCCLLHTTSYKNNCFYPQNGVATERTFMLQIIIGNFVGLSRAHNMSETYGQAISTLAVCHYCSAE